MDRSSSAKNVCRQILRYGNHVRTAKHHRCDVFISHRRIDTNKNVAGLIRDQLVRLRLRPFLDSKSMKPGDKLYEKIDAAIRECKVGIAVFSPHYCQSHFCLHELSMIMECRKKFIPIFVDVKPSELRVVDNGSRPANELLRFKEALDEAKHTVGLTFDSSNGDWSDLLIKASHAVVKNLLEVEGEQLGQKKQMYAKYSPVKYKQ